MSHSYMWYDSFICDITHSHVWHDSFTDTPECQLHRRERPLCEMTHSCMWHASFICVTWLIQTRDVTHSCMWHDSFICVTWLIQTRDGTHSYMWYDSFICMMWRIHTCIPESLHHRRERQLCGPSAPIYVYYSHSPCQVLRLIQINNTFITIVVPAHSSTFILTQSLWTIAFWKYPQNTYISK